MAGGDRVGEGGERGIVGVGFYRWGVLGEGYADAVVVHTVVVLACTRELDVGKRTGNIIHEELESLLVLSNRSVTGLPNLSIEHKNPLFWPPNQPAVDCPDQRKPKQGHARSDSTRTTHETHNSYAPAILPTAAGTDAKHPQPSTSATAKADWGS